MPAPHSSPARSSRPLISVIMPAHNVAAYVEEAIGSILAQTEGDFEVLALDDGSTDATYDIIASVTDPRLRLLRHETQRGAAASRNTLLDAARGEFLAFMDADDIALPDRFARQTALLRENPEVWLCGGHMLLINERGENMKRVLRAPLEHDAIKAMLLFACPFMQSCVMGRGGVWRKHAIRYDERLATAEDYELWQRIAITWPEARFANTDAILCKYRQHSQSLSSSDGTRWKRMETAARRNTFQALGFDPDDPEIAFHSYLYDITMPIPDSARLAGIFGWSVRLKEANDNTGLFPRGIFASMLANRLEEVVNFHPEHGPLGARLLLPWKKSVGGLL